MTILEDQFLRTEGLDHLQGQVDIIDLGDAIRVYPVTKYAMSRIGEDQYLEFSKGHATAYAVTSDGVGLQYELEGFADFKSDIRQFKNYDEAFEAVKQEFVKFPSLSRWIIETSAWDELDEEYITVVENKGDRSSFQI